MTDLPASPAPVRLHDAARAPNPRRVRIFLAEKGVTIPTVAVDMAKFEHRDAAHAALNPVRALPVLELADGTALSESVAICRYIEALHPEPNLFGATPLEAARVDMWNRRVEFGLYARVGAVFRHGHPGMAEHEVPQVAEWAAVNRDKVEADLAILDAALAGRPFLALDRFTIADITLAVAVDFMRAARLALPDRFEHLGRWKAAVAARPSMAA